jgi:hypothetical protein
MRTDNAADAWPDAVLEKCIFYIFPMYEFSHRLGHLRPRWSMPTFVLVRFAPKATVRRETQSIVMCQKATTHRTMISAKRKTASAAVLPKSDQVF